MWHVLYINCHAYICSHAYTLFCRKRTKPKTKAGRKKTKKDEPANVHTPRTRAASAREAARLAQEAAQAAEVAQEAEAQAQAAEAQAQAQEEAQAAEAQTQPQQAERAKRRLDLDEPVPIAVAGPSVPLEAITKKMTPRKKLATKVKKATLKKA
jgi:type II secretory pathway component HofQ